MKKFKLIQLNGDTCVACVENLWEIKKLIANFDDLEFIEVGELEVIKQYVEMYHCTHLPTLLLVCGNDCLGEVHGFQPTEILTYWIEAKIEEYLKKAEE